MSYDWDVVWGNRWLFLEGARMTIALAVLTMMFAIVGGLVLALLRMSPFRTLQVGATTFVEFFRATPLLLQLFWVFYTLPTISGIRFPAFETALVALTLNVSAFNSETFRAGITSIRRGQWHAGLAIGMSHINVMRHVVLPQAIWRVLPALASTWVSLFKDTSLVSTIAVADLAYSAKEIQLRTYRTLEPLTAMAVLYWLMGYPQAKLVDWIHRKFEVVE